MFIGDTFILKNIKYLFNFYILPMKNNLFKIEKKFKTTLNKNVYLEKI